MNACWLSIEILHVKHQQYYDEKEKQLNLN